MNFSRLLAGCLLVVVLCLTTTIYAQSDPVALAKEHFDAGLAHLDDPTGPKYEEAYREFHASYAAHPSYTTALNIGYCAYYLERDAEALAMYELYLAKAHESELPKENRTQLERDVLSLRAGLVHVTVRISRAGATLVDERFPSRGAPVVNRYPIVDSSLALGIHPGNHRLTIVADGLRSQHWDFDAQPGSSHSHEFKLESDRASEPGTLITSPEGRLPPTFTGRRISTSAYVGAIATGVLATGAIGMGLLASSKKDEFQSVNDGSQYSKAERLRSEVKTYALISDVCTGSAVIAAGLTAYLYFAKSPNQKAQASWKLVPHVDRIQMGMNLLRSF